MSNEFYIILVEFDTRSVKLGFAGERLPQSIINANSPLWNASVFSTEKVGDTPTHLNMGSHALEPDQRKQVEESLKDEKKYLAALRSHERDTPAQWFNWLSDHYRSLTRVIKTALSSQLLVTPRKCKLFIIDTDMSAAEKFLLCKQVLGFGCAASVLFLPHAPCSCLSAGTPDALIIRITWKNCAIVAVEDLRVVSVKTYQEFGIESLHYGVVSADTDTFDEIQERVERHMQEPEYISSLASLVRRSIGLLSSDTQLKIREKILIEMSFPTSSSIQIPLLQSINWDMGNVKFKGVLALGSWAGASIYVSTTLLKRPSKLWKLMEVDRLKLDLNNVRSLEISYS